MKKDWEGLEDVDDSDAGLDKRRAETLAKMKEGARRRDAKRKKDGRKAEEGWEKAESARRKGKSRGDLHDEGAETDQSESDGEGEAPSRAEQADGGPEEEYSADMDEMRFVDSLGLSNLGSHRRLTDYAARCLLYIHGGAYFFGS